MSDLQASARARLLDPRRRRILIATLVISQLLITLASAMLHSRITFHSQFESFLQTFLPSPAAGYFFSILAGSSHGLLVGQIVLIACWGAFANQPVPLRIFRFVVLCAWFALLRFLAEFAIEGEIVKLLVEENIVHTLMQFIVPLGVLLSFRFLFRRQFQLRELDQGKFVWQFNIRELLFITFELAALLALAKVVLPRNFHWDEIWPALKGLQDWELTQFAVSTTVLPAVFLGLSRRQTWRGYLLLGLYFLISAVVLSFLFINHLRRLGLVMTEDEWWAANFLSMCADLTIHLSAAATILLTFYLVRRIGYDFRRRDEPPRGRSSSSNARNSAASASA